MNKSQSKYFHTAARMDQAFLELLEQKDFEYITVKELCAKAGVNRSTFYLHYETMGDLLSESIAYLSDHFLSYMAKENVVPLRIADSSLEELHLVTPEYLAPYLRYIAEHRWVFRTALKNAVPLGMEKSYEKMFQSIFNPILERFQVPEQDRDYLMAFYMHGLVAIVTKWLENDCSDSIDRIIRLIQQCVQPHRKTDTQL